MPAYGKRNVQANWRAALDRFSKPSHRHPGFPGAWRPTPAGTALAMAANLGVPAERLKPLAVQDAEVLYLDRLPLGPSAGHVLARLIAEVPWRCEEVVMWGRRVPQPRLTAWYGDPGRRYAYSGLQLEPLPWTPLLADLKTRVEAVVGAGFNSVLLNYYRDHRDSIGFHSDNEPELGERPVIASLSLGAERVFMLKHKTSKRVAPVTLPLASGSLLLMKGDTQRHWRHGIARQSRPCGPRVNLTFRQILD